MSKAVVNRSCPNGQCAMRAGLVTRRLTFRDIFTAVGAFLSFVAALIGLRWRPHALALGSATG